MQTEPTLLQRPATLVALMVLGCLITAAAILIYTGRASSITLIGRMFNRVAAERGVRIMPAVAYGKGSRRLLDVYAPVRNPKRKSSPDNTPIIVFYYGGSWQNGDRALYRFVGTSLAKRGVTVVIPDYRLYPSVHFPKFMNDAADAYKWTWLNLAMQKNGKHRPIIVMGHSAGANMAALLTLNPTYIDNSNSKLAGTDQSMPRPAGLIGLAGPYAFDPLNTVSVKGVFDGIENPDLARPIAFVKNASPPTLLLHGAGDETVKLSNTRDLAAALKAEGRQIESEEFAGIGHMGLVTALAKPLRWRAPVLDRILTFMTTNSWLPQPKSQGATKSSGSAQSPSPAAPPTQMP